MKIYEGLFQYNCRQARITFLGPSGWRYTDNCNPHKPWHQDEGKTDNAVWFGATITNRNLFQATLPYSALLWPLLLNILSVQMYYLCDPPLASTLMLWRDLLQLGYFNGAGGRSWATQLPEPSAHIYQKQYWLPGCKKEITALVAELKEANKFHRLFLHLTGLCTKHQVPTD